MDMQHTIPSEPKQFTLTMLHELLLALSLGRTTPAFSSGINGLLNSSPSPSEIAIVQQLSRIGTQHIEIRTAASTIAASYPSTVCRAVATAVITDHLAIFQQKILRIEKGILRGDAVFVGSYDIIPLSSIVVSLDGWERKQEWLQGIVAFIQRGGRVSHKGSGIAARASTTGARLMEKLRFEQRTGFPDLEQLALSLGQVAESAWLRQVSAWVIYGFLPTIGGEDFFIQAEKESSGDSIYHIQKNLIPNFATTTTANSVLFIGKFFNRIRELGATTTELSSSAADAENISLLNHDLAALSSLGFPIVSPEFSNAITSIRTSLSKNALRKLLPFANILQVLGVLRSFFLLARGEFAISLIKAADKQLSARNIKPTSRRDQNGHRLDGIMIKEGEVSNILIRTWSALAALQNNEDEEVDEELEMGHNIIRLSTRHFKVPLRVPSSANHASRNDCMVNVERLFDDVLLATPITLSINVPSPLDLFLTPSELDIYSSVHAYLLAIRRTHVHMTELWKLSVLRRTYPSPGNFKFGQKADVVENGRIQANRRATTMRHSWATVSSAILFLAEVEEYLHGEVIAGSWNSFHYWLEPSRAHDETSPATFEATDTSTSSPNDPESLAVAHRRYLHGLVYSLLLNDAPFTKSLRAAMNRLDYIVLQITSLSELQQTLLLQETSSALCDSTDQMKEESQIIKGLAEVSASINDNFHVLINRLREVELQHIGGEYLPRSDRPSEEDSFVPWNGRGSISRLLTKLEGIRVSQGRGCR